MCCTFKYEAGTYVMGWTQLVDEAQSRASEMEDELSVIARKTVLAALRRIQPGANERGSPRAVSFRKTDAALAVGVGCSVVLF